MSDSTTECSTRTLVEKFNEELQAPFHLLDRLPYIADLWIELGRRGVVTQELIRELGAFGIDKRLELDANEKKLQIRTAERDLSNVIPFDLFLAKDLALSLFLLSLAAHREHVEEK